MRLPRVLASPWTWATRLTLAHLAATAAVIAALETFDSLSARRPMAEVMYVSVGGSPVALPHYTHELLVTSLTLLHLPLRALEEWWPSPWPRTSPWTVCAFILDSAVQSFAAVAMIRILARPPRRFRLPFLSRRVVLLGIALAAAHLTVSAAVIAAARYTGTLAYRSHPIRPALADAFQVLQPMVSRGALKPYGLSKPDSVGFLLLDSLAWGAIVALLIALVQRTIFAQADARYRSSIGNQIRDRQGAVVAIPAPDVNLMSGRFVLRGLILSGLMGAQTAWLLGADHGTGFADDAAWWLSFALHFPAAVVEKYLHPGSGPVLLLVIADCLLWGFTIAWLSVWLQRQLIRPKHDISPADH